MNDSKLPNDPVKIFEGSLCRQRGFKNGMTAGYIYTPAPSKDELRIALEAVRSAEQLNDPIETVATKAIRDAVFDVTGDEDVARRVVKKLRGDGSFIYADPALTQAIQQAKDDSEPLSKIRIALASRRHEKESMEDRASRLLVKIEAIAYGRE